MIDPFEVASIPKVFFGAGIRSNLDTIIPSFGNKILFVIGQSSLKNSGVWDEIRKKMDELNVNYFQISVAGEPSPSLIDSYATKYREQSLDIIISIGGGSVIDAGKAISAMIPHEDSITNYLEGVGSKKPDGKKIPFIALPTTSGTGSEATKNAVISQVGENGFKKSLRHDNYIPNIAIVDPELAISCPPSITAACGMDAFTQLYESYVSTKANPMMDALSYSGIDHMKDKIIPACTNAQEDIEVRAGLAYGSLMSGITLANAGLGVVHGFASSIGGLYEIPHGVVCGTLLAEAVKMNIKKLNSMGKEGVMSLRKHAKLGALLSDSDDNAEKDISYYLELLIYTLENWTNKLKLERLSTYGINEGDVNMIVEKTGLKNNPVSLTPEDMKEILKNRL
ncbi:MAG: Iron-containing alcohol dehydrogenase [Promethearchaeota archaeon]|nr:MAG: Iron-containing alcohol dehydrogenase [Candidatus Lokiarchaeota archaeon]